MTFSNILDFISNVKRGKKTIEEKQREKDKLVKDWKKKFEQDKL